MEKEKIILLSVEKNFVACGSFFYGKSVKK